MSIDDKEDTPKGDPPKDPTVAIGMADETVVLL